MQYYMICYHILIIIIYNDYMCIYIYIYTHLCIVIGRAPEGVGTLRYLLILSDNSACQVPICAVAA